MTVIAWDGKTLAADKRADIGGQHRTTTKIVSLGDVLLGITGDASLGRTMIEWFKDGRDASKFPEPQKNPEKFTALVAVHRDGLIEQFEYTPDPIRFEDLHFAAGSGRDYARAAMHLGRTAAEAVAVAIVFDPGCGNGIDTLTFE